MPAAAPPYPCLLGSLIGVESRVRACAGERRTLDALFGSIGEAIVTIDPGGTISTANRAFQKMVGRRADRIVGLPASDAIGKLIPGIATLLDRVVKEDRPIHELCLEVPARKGEGEPRTYVVTIEFLHAHAEQALRRGLLVVIRDTTELHALRRREATLSTFQRLIGGSAPMREVYQLIEHVAPTEAGVLIVGASGTGKELVAHSIHDLSTRSAQPFVKVNCSALSESLLESELFGHVRGAFTGALRDHVGRFELAHHGTIFLDEIGEVAPAVQIKLLRVLQERVIERVGDPQPRKVDVRIIAATHRNLRERIAEGNFREDLYFRLKIMEIGLPPLCRRRADIPILTGHFIDKFNTSYGRRIEAVAPQSLELLMRHSWPGNVRELENAIEHAFVLCKQGQIAPKHLPAEIRLPTEESSLRVESAEEGQVASVDLDWTIDPNLREVERIRLALRQTDGRVTRAARLLGMHRSTLWRKMRRHELV